MLSIISQRELDLQGNFGLYGRDREVFLQRRYTFRPAGAWFLVDVRGLYTFRPAGAKERLFSVDMSGFANSTYALASI